MNKILIVLMSILILFSGCTGQYAFEENDIGNINIDANSNQDDDGNVETNVDIETDNYNADGNFNLDENDGNVNIDADLNIEKKNSDQVICKDTDGGKNYYEYGKLTGENLPDFIYEDTCLSSGPYNLRETFCDIDEQGIQTVSAELYQCPYGCDNGVCLEEGNIEINLHAQYDDKVYLIWSTYKFDNFKYYKVVHSTTNPDLKYPEDGAIQVIEDRNKRTYNDDSAFQEGTNYYRITVLLEDGSTINSNVEKVYIEEDEDEQYDAKLEAKYDEDNKEVELKWDKYEGEDLKYYKVVHSTTNPDLKYPEDGYITYITDYDIHDYVDTAAFEEGTNYYRITTVLKDDSKIHSNVEKVYIE